MDPYSQINPNSLPPSSPLARLRALADELPPPDLDDRIQEQIELTQRAVKLLWQAYQDCDEQERRERDADEYVFADDAVEAYDRLMSHYGRAAISATLAEIADVLGCRARQASALLAELEQAGYVEKRPGTPPVRRLIVADQRAQPAPLNLDVPPIALHDSSVYSTIIRDFEEGSRV